MFNIELENQIRTILTGLAGIQTKCFEDENIEIWEIKAFKLKVIWNKKEFDIFYEDKSTDGATSRVIHNFKEGEEFISIEKFYIMIQEVAEGLQNSNLISAGNNYTDQDVRDSKVLSAMLINKLDVLIDIIYKDSLNNTDIEEVNENIIYLLIREDYNAIDNCIDTTTEGFTSSEIMARQYASHKEPFNQTSEYPKFRFEEVKRKLKI